MSDVAKLAVGLMARAPESGRVKTRLAADIGAEKATSIYRDLLNHISSELIPATRLAHGGDVSFYWFTDPLESIQALREAYPGFDGFSGQREGNLGVRMRHALETLLQKHEFAALIGADIPDLTSSQIGETLTKLSEHDVVLGPTFDGGYYLIGIKQMRPELFENIPWSANDTLSKTIAACESANISCHLLETLSDLDVLADFKCIKWRPHSVEIAESGLSNSVNEKSTKIDITKK